MGKSRFGKSFKRNKISWKTHKESIPLHKKKRSFIEERSGRKRCASSIFHGNERKSWEGKKRTFGGKEKDGEGDRDEPNDSKEDEAVTVESDGRRRAGR